MDVFGLHVKYAHYLQVGDRTYNGLIISCNDNAELILVDSIYADSIKGRIDSICWLSCEFWRCWDINNDGTKELRVNMSGGAHGFYSFFVSLFPDSITFLTTNFFAPTGNIELIPSENPSIYDIRVDNDPESGQIANYTIYRWNGKNYEVKETVTKPEK